MNKIKKLPPWLGKTTKMIGCFMKDALHDNDIDLTREQWIVLVKLKAKDGLAQNELAMVTERDKTSLTRLVDTMERKNLVYRKRSTADMRVNLIYLTDFGKNEYKRAIPVMQQSIKQLQSGLTEKEINNTIQTLQKLQSNLTHLSTTCGDSHKLNI